jgi:two-component system, NarL family, sensor histidine kinase DesK
MKTIRAQLARGFARWEHYLTSVEGAQEVIVSSGISLRLWRMYAQFWLVCLLFPILSLANEHSAPLRLLIALVSLVLYVTLYTWVMWPHPLDRDAHARFRFRTSLLLVAVLTILVLMLSLTYGSTFLWLFIGVSAVAGIALPTRISFATVSILTLLTLFIAVRESSGIMKADWLQIVPLVLLVRGLGLDMIGLARFSSALRELHAARGELARLAVMEERLRLARDLHDLLGHNLSLITLKSELAGRLLQQEPARAAQEIHEIEGAARQTLREVREAVSGYRQPRLESELDGTRQILEAAGIACTIEHTAPALPPATDAVLAWTVREGVTNVIRHSRARRCLTRVMREHGIVCAEVINDGNLRQEAQETEDAKARGSGLSGLTERVTSLGGRMEAGPVLTAGKEGFRLRVELPIQSSVEESQEERL